jgi:hypothetical protein
MPFRIFYSWQSKTIPKFNKYFIEECLKIAIKELRQELKDDSPDFYIDRDTKDVPGIPNIPTTIEGKIDLCDIFIADLSFIITPKIDDIEGIPAPNVTIELGYALGNHKTSARIVTIMNGTYGPPDKLSFDIKQRSFPIVYNYDDTTEGEDKAKGKRAFIDSLKFKIGQILRTELERQKPYFAPFYGWKFWEKVLLHDLQFEKTRYVDKIFSELRSSIDNPKSVYRVCGLSGIGKTRLLFECFRHKASGVPEEMTNKVLYVDVKEEADKTILSVIKEFIRQDENKILIIDNCPKQLHTDLIQYITNGNSRLSLITVSINPDERVEEIDTSGVTKMLVLDNQLCKETVSKILTTNFAELDKTEQDLLVDFSSGISFFATLMATNPNRGRYQPGSLRRQDIIERILGDLITNEDSRAVIYACCLFSKIGFFEELAFQANNLSEFRDLCNLKIQADTPEETSELKRRKFREICKVLNEKQLLEKKGRTFSFRPSPLAVRMAEEWWKDCTEPKFKRIIEFLSKNNLVESFCEQFQYLKHIENAQNIVKDLCAGVFSLAEVLNSNVGSRLFRSFVYVNPVACNNSLIKAFLDLSKAQLVGIHEGRRNLVWALEKLCFRDETFDDAIKVLAAFSIGENENIGNNATNQFLQLFHIHLAGTTVNLERRRNIIEHCLKKDDDYVLLGIKALSSSLAAGHFHRMGGAEEQGDVVPLQDYNPSGKEVGDYWRKAIKKLEELVFGKTKYSEKAIDILLENFYSLTTEGVGRSIIPVIEKIINAGLLDRMEARKKVQFVLNSKRVFDSEIVKELQRIFDSLSPNSFEEKFKIFVQSPSTEEYYTGDREDNHESLLKKIDELSKEFYQNKSIWNDLSKVLIVGNIYEGFNFGKALSKCIPSDPERVELLKLLITKLKEVQKENRNISVIIGLLSELSNKNIQAEIFDIFLSDGEVRDFSFAIARGIELRYEEIDKVLTLTKEGIFSTSQFSNFDYGWGIKHLSQEKIILILNSLRSIDKSGKAAAFFIIERWSHAVPDLWEKYKSQIKEQLVNDSMEIFEIMRGSMEYFYWSDPVIKLLDESNDNEFAEIILKIIIEECNDFEGYYIKENSFYKILEKIQEKYFGLLWEYVSNVYLDVDKFGMAAFHFKNLLGSRQDAYANTEGLLFKGDIRKFDTIFDWCRKNRGEKISWIAELLPIYHKNPDGNIVWHPYAKAFIDEFGENDEVLDHISAKIGTYSWVGSVVYKLEEDRRLFELLLDHPSDNVRNWANVHIADLDKRIKWERNRDEDDIWI